MKKTIIAMLLVACCITACFVGGTFAKYTSTVTGSDEATVAKWEIKAGVDGAEAEITVNAPTVAFNLFDTIVDTKDGNTDENVKTNLIAPGTKGSFNLSILNLSEVDAEYVVTFTVTNTENVPLTFKVNGVAATPNGEGKFTTGDAIAIAKETGDSVVTVEWEWAFDGDHTSIGIAAQDGVTVTVAAEITVSQVD